MNMNNAYEPVIGLEVHVELNTKSKMFCRCSADYFGAAPNSHTCPVCLGLPGALPFINNEAIKKCIQIGLALNCKVTKESSFERKNYFYPDLPKGYQISQYRWPLNVGGWIEVEGESGKKSRVRINRVHQEEDTGKLTHVNGETLIDFNRSGVPLVEIVTEPDFTDTAQIRDYAKKLQLIFRYLGVSNADMEKGDMRLEANVSLRPEHTAGLPSYRVELKNINSFKFLVAAVEYEIRRQTAALRRGERLQQETRGWNEQKKETYLQRSKEEAHDYRYFPEPDLPELRIDEEQIEQIKSGLPELPAKRLEKFMRLGIQNQSAKVMVEDKELGDLFERAWEYGKEREVDPRQLANYLINSRVDIFASDIAQLVDDLIAKRHLQISDDTQLLKWCKEAIEEDSPAVKKYKGGKPQVIMSLIGAVMKKSSGRAQPEKVKAILEELLKDKDLNLES